MKDGINVMEDVLIERTDGTEEVLKERNMFGKGLWDKDQFSLMEQVRSMSDCKIRYVAKKYIGWVEEYAEIYYSAIDSEALMKIVRSLVLCKLQHVYISAGYIKVYFDDITMMVIHW